MKNIIFIALLIVIIILAFVFFSSSEQNNQINQDKYITVEKGDTFSISLKSDITADFSWSHSPDGILKLLNEDFVYDNEKLLTTKIYKFEALETGKTKITFSYTGESENKDDRVDRIYEVVVTENN